MQPTMCSRCGKNVAIVFITKIENGQTKNEGLCLKCARELHIKPVDDVINKMGISDEDLDSITGDMMNALSGVEDMMDVDNDGSDDSEDDGKVVLEGHIRHCVRDGIEHGDADKTIENFTKAVERFSNMG